MTDRYPLGLYSSGMHDFILREMEVGKRVAEAEDQEMVDGWPSALLDLDYEEHMRLEYEHRFREALLDNWDWDRELEQELLRK